MLPPSGSPPTRNFQAFPFPPSNDEKMQKNEEKMKMKFFFYRHQSIFLLLILLLGCCEYIFTAYFAKSSDWHFSSSLLQLFSLPEKKDGKSFFLSFLCVFGFSERLLAFTGYLLLLPCSLPKVMIHYAADRR